MPACLIEYVLTDESSMQERCAVGRSRDCWVCMTGIRLRGESSASSGEPAFALFGAAN